MDVIRPLLGCRKLELVGYLEGLVPVQSWMEDSSNALPVYQRNRCVM
jgi:tRNA(Ile)-lysidine synthase TilS/MesJ